MLSNVFILLGWISNLPLKSAQMIYYLNNSLDEIWDFILAIRKENSQEVK